MGNEELTVIGEKINRIVEEAKASLTLEDIEAFQKYLDHFTTVEPLVDPTRYMRVAKHIPNLEKQVECLKALIQI